ncbi:MAG: twin-arginine translocation signal domain-containing protein, partial [Candidatus Acidiferrales bacterium]
MTNSKPPQSGTPKSPRRKFLQTTALTGIAAALSPSLRAANIDVRDNSATSPSRTNNAPIPAAAKPFELDEITIADLQDNMKSGKYTARSIAELYLSRIDAVDT